MQPGARRSEVAGEYQGCLKIRLQAPAVDNKANKALVAFVAKNLNMKKSQVAIKSGHTNRRKLLALDTAEALDWESLLLSGGPQQP
ncbi:hypothetical protein JCM14722_00700 [Pseudodesulfovibrio portus]|uniref:UPF0235 protein JCM14722_00700 n=1 Tax=Pseudodesulfovibrio portus TaxID=231439 RepID=A0ABN6RQF8_9BACT|nr:hypothetical protein JCM14722_00700 [Pseudodesulfovibrio portus]